MSLELLPVELVEVAKIALANELYPEFFAVSTIEAVFDVSDEVVAEARDLFMPVWSEAFLSIYPEATKREIVRGFVEFTKAFKIRG